MFEQRRERREGAGRGSNEEGWEAATEETSVPASYMQIAAALRLRVCDDKTVAHSEARFDLESLKIDGPRLPPGTVASAEQSRRSSRRLLVGGATVRNVFVCLFIFKQSFQKKKGPKMKLNLIQSIV